MRFYGSYQVAFVACFVCILIGCTKADKKIDELAESARYADLVKKVKSGDEETTKEINALIIKAESGDADANYLLGLIFKEGDGGNSADFFEKAAELGNSDAQVEIALALFQGRGTKNDKATAFKWALISNENGNKKAEQLVVTMQLFLSRGEYEVGKAMARNWLLKDNNKTDIENNLK